MASEPSFEIRLTAQAERIYRRLPVAVRNRVDVVFERFEHGDFTSSNITALHGPYKGRLRYRLGGWRIIFSVDRADTIVWIEAISTRGGAYRKSL